MIINTITLVNPRYKGLENIQTCLNEADETDFDVTRSKVPALGLILEPDINELGAENILLFMLPVSTTTKNHVNT